MMDPIRKKVLSAAFAAAGLAIASLPTSPALADGSVVVRDFMLSHGVEGREPVNQAESFSVEDGRAFAFARIKNTGEPTTVNFVWYYDDKSLVKIPVNVGRSPGWRTWSSVTLRPGKWRVELVDASGAVLIQKAFNAKSKAAGPAAMPEPQVGGDPAKTADR